MSKYILAELYNNKPVEVVVEEDLLARASQYSSADASGGKLVAWNEKGEKFTFEPDELVPTEDEPDFKYHQTWKPRVIPHGPDQEMATKILGDWLASKQPEMTLSTLTYSEVWKKVTE